MTERMTKDQYQALIAKSSVSKTGRVVRIDSPPAVLQHAFRKGMRVLATHPDLPAKDPSTKKYGNKKVMDGELKFDSKHELKQWHKLQMLQTARQISELQRQVKFRMEINGIWVCTYTADFTYMEKGQYVVADAKGKRTPVYNLKKRMLKAMFGHDIVEL